MKKRIVIGFVAGFFLLAGCGSGGNSEALENGEVIVETTEEMAATETEVTEVAAMLEVEEPSNLISYAGETYTWNEITLTVPSAWEEKYIIKEEANGFSFYQKASVEIEDSLGYLCGIYKSATYSNSGAGDTLLAYTGAGMCYYLMQPTDVTCYLEKEEIVEEYMQMMEMVSWIAGGVEIAAQDIYYDVSQHVIPVSSIMKLEAHQVVNLSDNELWIARNEIYARHGKLFQNEYLQAYFNARSWYQPKEGKNDVTERELSEVEIANLELLVAVENAFEAAHPYPVSCEIGSTIEADLMGTGVKQEILYEVSILDAEQSEYRCVLTIDGTSYRLSKYVDISTPELDVFYLTDIAPSDEFSEFEDGLEIAVLDYGASADPVTHFFKYDGNLIYIGDVEGHPFAEFDYRNGFTYQNSVIGQSTVDLIETAYVDSYYWYDVVNQKIVSVDYGLNNYKWFNAHELYVDIPVYYAMDEKSPARILKAQKEVYFIRTDRKEWIFVQGKDGTEGYIQVKDRNILNIGLPAEEVFSDLYFFG